MKWGSSKEELPLLPFLERKAIYFDSHEKNAQRKRWYYNNYPNFKLILRVRHFINWLIGLKLPKHISFLRWILVDMLRGKKYRFMGIYQYVGLPGEGKTMSMVAHIDRVLQERKNVFVATNFNFLGQDGEITHWIDIVNFALQAHEEHRPCLIAVDEIQNTFDSADWRSFPQPLYTLLTFNRKLELEFLCSAQLYDRIPSKIRNLANYTVICKNVWKRDRFFINYYFEKNNYESQFDGKRVKADFVRDFIADDEFYTRYDSFEQVKAIKQDAAKEKDAKAKAFDLLFGPPADENEPTSTSNSLSV